MCRLFGAISNRSINAEHLLLSAPQSLYVQSRVDLKRPQGDGWGAGWFEAGHPQILKSSHPMYRDKTRVSRGARKAKGTILVGHVRWASNPLKLKRRELIGLAHTQPFTHGKWIFAHNGTLYIPKEVAAHLGPWKKYLKGKNDSEVLFYWLLKHLKGKNYKKAVQQSIQGIHRIWDACKKSYPLHPYPYHGLNWVLTNGKVLVAFCYTDPRGFGKSKALCNTKECYYQLRRQVTPSQAFIASEPIDQRTSWQEFRHGELFWAERRGPRLVTHQAKIL